MTRLKCWNCGKDVDIPYTAKEKKILNDPDADDDDLIEIYEKREQTSKRLFCEECGREHRERYEKALHDYCRLRMDIMYERALKIFERQYLDVYEYKRAADAVKEFITDQFAEAEKNGTTEYSPFDSADEIAAAIVLLANEIRLKVHPKIKKYEVDFAIPSMKVILEIDGELYHRGKEKKESRRDIDIRRMLGEDWEVIRIPTKYIHQNIELLPENIRSLKEERAKIRKTYGYIPDSYSVYKS